LPVSLDEAIGRARVEAAGVGAARNLERHESFRAMQSALMEASALAMLGSCIAKETGWALGNSSTSQGRSATLN
jgi:hypothetical protein